MSVLMYRCLFAHVCVCVHNAFVCHREKVCGCTLSPRNSICVVNAPFKTINIHSGITTTEVHVRGLCVCVCTSMTGALMQQGEYAWACVWAARPPSDRFFGSWCAEVLSCCWRGLPEWEETDKNTHTHTPKPPYQSWQPLCLFYLRWSSIAWMHLCSFASCYHARTKACKHPRSCTYTHAWTQPSSHLFTSLCVLCGLWRTLFKGIFLQLWSCSVSPPLLLLFPLLSSVSMRPARESKKGTCPTCAVYHVLYLWTWEISWVKPIVSCEHNTLRLFPKHCGLFHPRANQSEGRIGLKSFQPFIKH